MCSLRKSWAASSFPQSRTTTEEHRTTFLSFPSASSLQSPAYLPNCMLSGKKIQKFREIRTFEKIIQIGNTVSFFCKYSSSDTATCSNYTVKLIYPGLFLSMKRFTGKNQILVNIWLNLNFNFFNLWKRPQINFFRRK